MFFPRHTMHKHWFLVEHQEIQTQVFRFEITSSFVFCWSSSAKSDDNQWHHMCYTLNTGTGQVACYTDGVHTHSSPVWKGTRPIASLTLNWILEHRGVTGGQDRRVRTGGSGQGGQDRRARTRGSRQEGQDRRVRTGGSGEKGQDRGVRIGCQDRGSGQEGQDRWSG